MQFDLQLYEDGDESIVNETAECLKRKHLWSLAYDARPKLAPLPRKKQRPSKVQQVPLNNTQRAWLSRQVLRDEILQDRDLLDAHAKVQKWLQKCDPAQGLPNDDGKSGTYRNETPSD